MKKRESLLIFLRLTWRLQPVIFFWLLAGAILTTGGSLLTAAIPKLLIDAVTRGEALRRLMLLIFLLAGLKYVVHLLSRQITLRQQRQRELLTEQYVLALSDKVMRIDYAHLEDPDILDLRERSHFALTSYGVLMTLFESAVSFLTGALTLVTVTGFLLSFSPWLFLAILILAVSSLLLSHQGTLAMKKSMEKILPINRVYSYFLDNATRPEHQKEFRIYDMSALMVARIKTLNRETAGWVHQLNVLQGNLASLQGVLQYLTRFITLAYAAARTLSRRYGPQISIGDFTFYIGLSNQFTQSLSDTVESIFMVNQALGMLEPMAVLMQIPDSESHGGTLQPDGFESLAFSDVCFTYPRGTERVLDQVSFQINRGERISIVGLNNAGKTTIVKLICRLFEPDSGTILLNGKRIGDYDYQAYLTTISAVFQDFCLFPFTIRENLDPGGRTGSDEPLRTILEQVGLRDAVDQLPQGINTFMDKSLHRDATDFSGGQRQKLAIARAIHKNSDLLILDEPTAALDPLAESEIFHQFAELVKGKTSIFISHRMSSSVFCDKILLLQDGRVQAFDTHRNLMRRHNLYRTLFETQAHHFRTVPDPSADGPITAPADVPDRS